MPKFPMATPKSVKFLTDLLDETGFSTHKQKMAFIHKRFEREGVMGVGDLYQFEASLLISSLQEQKARAVPQNRYSTEEED